jgi:hypothetical protein
MFFRIYGYTVLESFMKMSHETHYFDWGWWCVFVIPAMPEMEKSHF